MVVHDERSGSYPSSKAPGHIHFEVAAEGMAPRFFEIVFEDDPVRHRRDAKEQCVLGAADRSRRAGDGTDRADARGLGAASGRRDEDETHSQPGQCAGSIDDTTVRTERSLRDSRRIEQPELFADLAAIEVGRQPRLVKLQAAADL